MSRFYEIKITNSDGSDFQTYTSFKNGKTLPGALNVEYNIPVVPYAQPYGNAYVRIWGIPLSQISQASDLNGKNVIVSGGFKKGLPLAKESQAGVLVMGTIFQAYGNWIGTDMTLDLDIIGGQAPNQFGALPAQQPNLTLSWKKGTKLADAVKQTLSTAFPKIKQNIKISDKLVLTNDDTAFFNTLGEFSRHVKDVSASIEVAPDYPGVDIFMNSNNTLEVFDGTTQDTPASIAFEDLIGQPTWIESPIIQFKCPMRADLSVNDFVKLPPGLQTALPGNTLAQSKLKTSFKGAFQIIEVVHYGNFRQPDAASWVTVFNATPSQNNPINQ